MSRWNTVAVISWFAAALAAVLAAGCAAVAHTEGDVGRQSKPGGRPDTYTYVLDSSCGERSLVGRFRIEVVDGSVVAVEGLDDTGRATVDQDGADEAPTIADLLDEAATARRRGADVVVVETTRDGRPTRITIDGGTEAYDDEACYVISDVTDAN